MTAEPRLRFIDLCTSLANSFCLLRFLVVRGYKSFPRPPLAPCFFKVTYAFEVPAICCVRLCTLRAPRIPSVLPDVATNSSSCERKGKLPSPSESLLCSSDSHLGKSMSLSYQDSPLRHEKTRQRDCTQVSCMEGLTEGLSEGKNSIRKELCVCFKVHMCNFGKNAFL